MKHKMMKAHTGWEPICVICGKLFFDENEECPGAKTPPPPVQDKVTIPVQEYEALLNIANEAKYMHSNRMLMTRTMLDWLSVLDQFPKTKI